MTGELGVWRSRSLARYLSFDFGTGGVRAGVYCTDRLSMIAVAEAAYPTEYPRAAWAEQDCRHWIDAMVEAGAKAVDEAEAPDIAAICVATTASTVVFCSREGEPVRPAILWMDARASAESQRTSEVDHPVMAYCGGSDAVEWLVPKAMWVARHEPDAYARAEIVCEAIDFVNYHLTGRWVGSRMNAACKWNYDSLTGAFVPEIYDRFGIPDLADKLPPEILPVGAPIIEAAGPLLERMGIAGRPLVAQGGIDAHIGMLGANTVAPGSMLIIGGTSVVQLTQLRDHAALDGFWGPYPNALIDGLWLVESGQVSAGSIIYWLVKTVFGLDDEGHRALMSEVQAAGRDGHGLLALDYWMGNRTPYRDADLRGAIMGLSLGHSRADIYAAIVDAVALGSANAVAALADHGVRPKRFVMAGGICGNPVWLQATVDALGAPVSVARDDNLSLIGGAVCSAAASGAFDDLTSAAAAMAAPTEEVVPVEDRRRWYQETLGLYREATVALRPVLHALSGRHDGGDAT